jgi:outer membrane lipase/esterase
MSGLSWAIALGAALLALSEMPSWAQVGGGRVVVFGDSLSDNGNLFATNGQPAAPYFNGRFSNGPIWIERLFGHLNSPVQGTGVLGNVDLAFGGARTDSAPNGGIPGIPAQIGIFQGAGGHLAANDLVVAWGGGNDLIQFFQTTPPAGVTAASVTASSTATAASMVGDIQAMIGIGGRQFLVPNLPNLGATPGFNGNGTTAGQAQLATDVFNASLAGGLRQVAASAPGVDIIQMDVRAAFDLIRTHPAAYGFANVTQPCFNSVANTVCANPNSYFFWDAVHPTETGSAWLATLAGLYLDQRPAAIATAPLAESGIWIAQQTTDAAFDRLQSWIAGAYALQNGVYVSAIGTGGRLEGSGNRLDANLGLYGVRGGIDRRFGNFLLGAAGTYLAGSVEETVFRANVESFTGDVYASAFLGRAFFNADMGFGGRTLGGIVRATGFGPEIATASTTGFQLGAAVEAGYVYRYRDIALIPIARLTWLKSTADAYDEVADILAYHVDGRDVSALLGGVRLRGAMPVTLWPHRLAAFAEVGYEGYLGYRSDAAAVQLINNTALPTAVSLDAPRAPGLQAKAGVNGRVNDHFQFEIQYGIAAQGGGVVHGGRARIKMPL